METAKSNEDGLKTDLDMLKNKLKKEKSKFNDMVCCKDYYCFILKFFVLDCLFKFEISHFFKLDQQGKKKGSTKWTGT